MKISREDVLRVAELGYLDLSEEEMEKYRQQLDSILEYVEKLNQLDTAYVEPMAQVLGAAPSDEALREDLAEQSGVGREVLERAPDPEPPYFCVPKVIERDTEE